MSQSPSQTDLVIIGAGIAGLAAAQMAREKGREPLLVAPGAGATQHFSGAFDLIDPRWQDPTGKSWLDLTLTTAFQDWVRAHPEHLYARLSGDPQDYGRRLIGRMRAFFDFYGIPFVGDGERFVLTFGSAGRVKPCAFALATQGLLASEFSRHQDVVYVNPPYLSDYPVAAILQELRTFFPRVRCVDLTAFALHRQAPLAILTQRLDENGGVERLKNEVEPQLGGATLLLMPPLLGRRRALENHRFLEKTLQVRVVELLSALPSVSGLRLADYFAQALPAKALTRLNGEVQSAEVLDRRVASLTVRTTTGQNEIIKPRDIVLATGKFLGGGIRHENKFFEPLFQLPLFVGGALLNPATHVTQLLNPRALERQAFMTVGVRTDDQGRPVFQDEVLYANLQACGHVLSDFDFARERCGFGVSIASAWRCFDTNS